jgi:hypothetical protein
MPKKIPKCVRQLFLDEAEVEQPSISRNGKFINPFKTTKLLDEAEVEQPSTSRNGKFINPFKTTKLHQKTKPFLEEGLECIQTSVRHVGSDMTLLKADGILNTTKDVSVHYKGFFFKLKNSKLMSIFFLNRLFTLNWILVNTGTYISMGSQPLITGFHGGRKTGRPLVKLKTNSTNLTSRKELYAKTSPSWRMWNLECPTSHTLEGSPS